MTKTQALAEARRRWGKTARVRDSGRSGATTPEGRAVARAELAALRTEKDSWIVPHDERGAWATLSPEQQERRTARVARKREWQARHDYLLGVALHKRFAVGYAMLGGLAFGVQGTGDTWEDAFAEVDERTARDTARSAKVSA